MVKKNNFIFHCLQVSDDVNNVSEATPAPPKVSLFQIEFYQQFFNIDTMEVVDRIASSMIPKRASSTYLKTHLVSSMRMISPPCHLIVSS